MATTKVNNNKISEELSMYKEIYSILFKQVSKTLEALEEKYNLSNTSDGEYYEKVRNLTNNQILSLKLTQQKTEKIYISFSSTGLPKT